MKAEGSPFSLSALVWRSLCYYWRAHVAVVLGIAAAAAALVGSLLVGDSVKGTLRDIALERLGRTDYALTAPRFFRDKMAADLTASPLANGAVSLAVPAITLRGTAKRAASQSVIPRVNVIGVDDEFWRLWSAKPPAPVEGRRVLINQVLADALDATPGDALLVTIGRRSAAPTDTAFGRRDRRHALRRMRVVVSSVLPSHGAGLFSLRTDQPRPRNLYISMPWLQRQLGREAQTNAILLSSTATLDSVKRMLESVVNLPDFGLRVSVNRLRGYISLQSRELVLPAPVVEAAKQAASASGMRLTLTSVYLANSLRVVSSRKSEGACPTLS